MPLYRGGARIARLYRGATPIARAYRGGVKVHDTETAGVTKSLAFIGSDLSTSDLDTYTFTGKSLGTPHASRRIIVAVGSRDESGGGSAITSVAVGGVTASEIFQTGTTHLAGLFIAHVPAGETGNIVVNYSNATSRIALGWWQAHGLSSNTPHDVKNSSGDPGSISLGTLDGGFALAVAEADATTTGFGWTNATERFDYPNSSLENRCGVSGADVVATNGSALNIQADGAGTTATLLLAGASL
jgi:hypothetical protein